MHIKTTVVRIFKEEKMNCSSPSGDNLEADDRETDQIEKDKIIRFV